MKKIQILGGGCAKCDKLAELSKEAADSLGIDYNLEKVTDINKITATGVMMTPALVVDGEVKTSGKVPKIDEIKKMIQG